MIAYLDYQIGTTKGASTQGTTFNDPFKLGDIQSDYTSQAVTEAATAGTGEQAIAWTPVVEGVFPVTVGTVTTNYDVKLLTTDTSTGAVTTTYAFYNAADKKFYTTKSGGTYSSQVTVPANTKVAYKYDNEIIPQNDLPTIKGVMKNMTLLAHARRIAIRYSQIAAYQAKTDYGFDLADQLAEQAVGLLAYEIDQEIIELLASMAKSKTTEAELAKTTWSKTLPVNKLAA